MKKSLVALAALALAGVASAQVSLSGSLAFGYQADKAASGIGGAKANGLLVTDGNFVLTASEDLGGGLKATAMMDVKSRGRDTAIEGRDASLTLAGGFGSVMIGAIEMGNGLLGLGAGGAPVRGLDGADGGLNRAVLSGGLNSDVLMYTSPSMGGFTVSAALLDATAGLGMQSAALTQDATLLGATFTAGPFAVAGDYTRFGANAAPAPLLDDRIRLSASYDLGMVKFGAGYEKLDYVGTVNENQYLLGVSAPVTTALTIGANYVRNTKDAANDMSAYELVANYALSKRTAINVTYQSIDEDTVSGNSSSFRAKLIHSF